MHAFIAASRFGLGARPEELSAMQGSPRAWLLAQLGPPEPTPELDSLPSSQSITRALPDNRMASREKRRATRKQQKLDHRRECASWLQTAATSAQPFRERLIAFFANHFTVSIARKEVMPFAGAFVREAIRPHVLGRFEDLLLATMRHPAMLLYLDNQRSIGPHSPAGLRNDRGLNENYAREVLELHTLGVEGGYTQADVEAFARMLTGWTFERKDPSTQGQFRFQGRRHQPGAATLLGKAYPQLGETQGIAAARELANHPSTAAFIAFKLARHFIADIPPEAAVRSLTKVFLDTHGDLHALATALVELESAWEPRPQKIRSPLDLVLAAARSLAREKQGDTMVASLETLGQPLFSAPSPEGWPDTAAEWLSPDAMLSRVEWAQQLGETLDSETPTKLDDTALGPQVSAQTRLTLQRATSPGHRLALLVSSPEFQRR